MSEFRYIAIDELHESPLNPRKQFGAIDELTESVKAVGIIQPLLVRPVADGAEIAAGHRRFRAAKAAGLLEVPAVVREMDDSQFLEVLTFENLNRADLHPLEEAAGFRTLMRDLGYDVAAIAQKLGKSGDAKSISHVYARMKLLDLTEEAQSAFLDGRHGMTAGHAVLIARRQPKDQKKCLAKMEPPSWNPQQVVSVRELANFIRHDLEIELAQAPFPIADVALVLEAGSCDSCAKRSGNDPTQAEPSEKDLCQDTACYKRKLAAWLDRRRAELREQGEFVELSYSYSTKTKGVVPFSDWDAVGEREKGPAVKTGLVVEGHDVGQVLRVKVKEKPQTCDDGRGSGTASTGRSAAQAKAEYERAQAELDEKRKAERAARVRVLDAILREVKWPLGRAVVVRLLAAMTANEDSGELFDQRHEGVFGYDDEANGKVLAKMQDLELARVAVEFLACPDVDDVQYGKSADTLMDLARAYGVDYRRLHDGAETKPSGTKPAAAKSKAVKKAAPKKPAEKKTAAKKAARKK